MNRFFVDKSNIDGDKVYIEGEDVKHIKNVLRLKVDDIISVCDKAKTDYIVKISAIDKSRVEGVILNQEPSKAEANIDIILYQGLPKAAKMELIVQKAVELGVTEIVPVITERTVVKIQDKNKEEKKLDRWNRISEEAAKQSKRAVLPQISSIITFDEMIKTLSNESFVIVPYENEEQTNLKEILKGAQTDRVSIIIGPEGGFGDEEIIKLKNIGAHVVTLGPRILRTETAGFTTIAIVMYELGDLGVI